MEVAQALPLPTVRVTNLAKFLAGQSHCDWSLWYRTKNPRYPRTPSTFNRPKWASEHTQLLRQRVETLQAEGYETFLEHQNDLSVRGQVALLTGRPDIIAVKGEVVLIVDCKSAAENVAHLMQVLIYMLILPRGRRALTANKTVCGEVYYPGGVVRPLDPQDLTPAFREVITMAVRAAAGESPPATTPSWAECQWCDIEACPHRVREAKAEEGDGTDWF